jgi:CheY-like chemotaxis protein
MGAQSHLHELAEEPEIQQNGGLILVADDDPSMVHLLEEDLTLEGHKVVRAYDGHMALRLAQQQAFDLIILDVNMPIANGLKVFQFLRASAKTKKIPVIFVTGELTKNVYPVIAQDQRVAHLKKPLDLESFNSLVKLFLDRYPVT